MEDVSLLKNLKHWLQWPQQPWYPACEWVWFTVFLTGFYIVPNEPMQRVLFYAAIPLTAPAVWRIRHVFFASLPGCLLTAFLAWSTLSVLWSPPHHNIFDFGRKALCIFYFALQCTAFGWANPKKWRTLLLQQQIIAGVIALGLAVWFLLSTTDTARFVGLGEHANSNYTAGILGAVALAGIAAIFDSQQPRAKILFLCQIPLLYLLVLTGSRAALCSYLSGVILCVALQTFRLRHKARHTWAALLGILAVLATLLASRGTQWLSNEIARGDTYRLLIWRTNWHYICQHPWFGYGAATVEHITANGAVIGLHAHNIFLAQWFYSGILGVSLWTGIVLTLGYKAWRVWQLEGQLLPLACMWFLFVLTSTDMGWLIVEPQALWFYCWLIVGIILSYPSPCPERAITA